MSSCGRLMSRAAVACSLLVAMATGACAQFLGDGQPGTNIPQLPSSQAQQATPNQVKNLMWLRALQSRGGGRGVQRGVPQFGGFGGGNNFSALQQQQMLQAQQQQAMDNPAAQKLSEKEEKKRAARERLKEKREATEKARAESRAKARAAAGAKPPVKAADAAAAADPK
jgi:hypothetical protein